jgi:hypothetical protein
VLPVHIRRGRRAVHVCAAPVRLCAADIRAVHEIGLHSSGRTCRFGAHLDKCGAHEVLVLLFADSPRFDYRENYLSTEGAVLRGVLRR